GTPYKWAGDTPAGFDCSGFTQYVYDQVGIDIPRTSSAQAAAGEPVSEAAAEPGDLVWWPGHVGIYTGDDTYIAARNPGTPLYESKIWNENAQFFRVSCPPTALQHRQRPVPEGAGRCCSAGPVGAQNCGSGPGRRKSRHPGRSPGCGCRGESDPRSPLVRISLRKSIPSETFVFTSPRSITVPEISLLIDGTDQTFPAGTTGTDVYGQDRSVVAVRV